MKIIDKKKIILIIIIAAAFFYADYSFVIKTQVESVKTLKNQTTKLKEEMNSLDKTLADFNNLKNKQDRLGTKRKKIFSEERIPALLEDISDIANKNSVKIMQIRPSKEVKARDEKARAQGQGGVVGLTISLDLSCSYHNLGSFVNDMENADTFIAVQEMKIRRDQNNPLEETANLVLKTYVKKSTK